VAKVLIAIDTQGNPTPSYVPAKGGDQVYWKAADPTQTWYIRFSSPFSDDAIVTDPTNNGETKPKKVRKAAGTYPYMVSDSNGSLLYKSDIRPFTSGGGIIVEA
jgi:hypothetical protein